eukprot:5645557-Lingulodinium_polyedra.AAC.1
MQDDLGDHVGSDAQTVHRRLALAIQGQFSEVSEVPHKVMATPPMPVLELVSCKDTSDTSGLEL